MEYKIKNLVFLEAPNFSEFLMDNFDGELIASEAREVRQGFNSERNEEETLLFGPGRFRTRIDEDKFYKLKEYFPAEKYFIGPYYNCLIKKINFMPPEKELEEMRENLKKYKLFGKTHKRSKEDIEYVIKKAIETLAGELRIYPQFKDKKTANSPMIYHGFRPGVGYHNRTGLDYVRLLYGSYANLSQIEDCFKNGFNRKIRGGFWRNSEYKRYDGHKDIPFP